MKIAFPTSNQKTICEYIPFCKYIMIIDTDTKEKKLLNNPLYEKVKNEHIKKRECGENAMHTGQILPPILKNEGVDLFVALHLGEGMLDNLEVYGIKYKITQKREINNLLNSI